MQYAIFAAVVRDHSSENYIRKQWDWQWRKEYYKMFRYLERANTSIQDVRNTCMR